MFKPSGFPGQPSCPSWTPVLHTSHRLRLCQPWKSFRFRIVLLLCLLLNSVPVTSRIYGPCIPIFFYTSRNLLQLPSHPAASGTPLPSGWTSSGSHLPGKPKAMTLKRSARKKLHPFLDLMNSHTKNLLITCEVKMTITLPFTRPVHRVYAWLWSVSKQILRWMLLGEMAPKYGHWKWSGEEAHCEISYSSHSVKRICICSLYRYTLGIQTQL